MSKYPRADRSLLEHISTHWTMIEDPTKFVLRYAPAIREYIDNLLRGKQDTEDVTQEFLTVVMSRGFSEQQVTRGRFRDFLRVAIRNAVIDHLRVKRIPVADHQMLEETIAAQDETDWINYWRGCVLDAAWLKLRQHQKSTPGNLYFTVLKTSTENPDKDSPTLAEIVSRLAGKPIKPDAFRQQLHRSRHKFAEILVAEVKDTLRDQTADELNDELRILGLDKFVEDYVSSSSP
jgi:RNA polymerase sigma-70 factor (ECF subfamily)